MSRDLFDLQVCYQQEIDFDFFDVATKDNQTDDIHAWLLKSNLASPEETITNNEVIPSSDNNENLRRSSLKQEDNQALINNHQVIAEVHNSDDTDCIDSAPEVIEGDKNSPERESSEVLAREEKIDDPVEADVINKVDRSESEELPEVSEVAEDEETPGAKQDIGQDDCEETAAVAAAAAAARSNITTPCVKIPSPLGVQNLVITPKIWREEGRAASRSSNKGPLKAIGRRASVAISSENDSAAGSSSRRISSLVRGHSAHSELTIVSEDSDSSDSESSAVRQLTSALDALRPPSSVPSLTRSVPLQRGLGKRRNMSFSNEEDRRIQRENEILLRKIISQKSRAPRPEMHRAPSPARCSHTVNRKQRAKVIDHDNEILLKKIQDVKRNRGALAPPSASNSRTTSRNSSRNTSRISSIYNSRASSALDGPMTSWEPATA